MQSLLSVKQAVGVITEVNSKLLMVSGVKNYRGGEVKYKEIRF